MNTSKQVNVMLGLFMVFVLGTLLYFLWDTTRAERAEERQLEVNAERGGKLYAINCRACHGLTGQGPLENPILPGAPLNLDAYRPTEMGQLNALQQRLRDTIKCGRVGTLMPPWSQEQGGPLNDFQIEQLVLLITSAAAETGWQHALEEANHADELGKALAVAVSESDTVLKLNNARGLKVDDLLRIDDDPLDAVYEVVKVVAVREAQDEIEVERGVAGTQAAAHQEGAEVFLGPILPPEGPLTGEAGTPPCGQRPAAPVAATPTPGPGVTPTPGASPTPLPSSITLNMGDNFFELDGQRNPTLTLKSGQSVTIRLSNVGAAIHNMRTAGEDNRYGTADDDVSNPQLINAGQQGTIVVTLDRAGTYDYRCDIHPDVMKGRLNVIP